MLAQGSQAPAVPTEENHYVRRGWDTASAIILDGSELETFTRLLRTLSVFVFTVLVGWYLHFNPSPTVPCTTSEFGLVFGLSSLFHVLEWA